jgi:hypothetical protein
MPKFIRINDLEGREMMINVDNIMRATQTIISSTRKPSVSLLMAPGINDTFEGTLADFIKLLEQAKEY